MAAATAVAPPLDVRVHRRVLAAGPDDPVDDRALAHLVRAEAPLLDTAEVTGVVARVRARIGGLGPLALSLKTPIGAHEASFAAG